MDKVLGKELLKLSVQDNVCCVCVCEKRPRFKKESNTSVLDVDELDAYNKVSKPKLLRIFLCCFKVQNEHEETITEEEARCGTD